MYVDDMYDDDTGRSDDEWFGLDIKLLTTRKKATQKCNWRQRQQR